jgi:ABC-type glycerol-3-phosphate transport system substrate-binding protein
VKNGAEMGGWVISLAKGSKHKEDALRFMKFVASSEGSTIYADTQGAMVPRQSDFQKKIDAAEGPMKVKLQKLLLNLNNAESVDLTKLGASYDASVKIMNATVNMALTGKVTPQEAMDSAKKQLEELLKKDKFLEK